MATDIILIFVMLGETTTGSELPGGYSLLGFLSVGGGGYVWCLGLEPLVAGEG